MNFEKKNVLLPLPLWYAYIEYHKIQFPYFMILFCFQIKFYRFRVTLYTSHHIISNTTYYTTMLYVAAIIKYQLDCFIIFNTATNICKSSENWYVKRHSNMEMYMLSNKYETRGEQPFISLHVSMLCVYGSMFVCCFTCNATITHQQHKKKTSEIKWQ